MGKRLTENLSSLYVGAANKLKSTSNVFILIHFLIFRCQINS